MIDRTIVLQKTCAAIRTVIDDPARSISPADHLIDDFELDSAAVASLTIALEDQFDDVLLLNEWIASADDPSALTVASLVDYLTDLLADGA